MPLTEGAFAGYGAFILIMICTFPAWDAIGMLLNENYTFWMGRNLPLIILIMCGLILCVFLISTEVIFTLSPLRDVRIQSLMLVPTFLLTMLALSMVLVSMPMSIGATTQMNDLTFRCGHSPETRRLQRHYFDLLYLRTQPECKELPSIENCEGYQEDDRHSVYLKFLESRFRCSGFCHAWELESFEENMDADLADGLEGRRGNVRGQMQRALQPGDANEGAEGGALPPGVSDVEGLMDSIVNFTRWHRGRGAGNGTVMGKSGQAVINETVGFPVLEWGRPPALFSTQELQVTCDGAAARDLLFVANDRANNLWASGVVFLIIALVMALWDWTPIKKRL